MWEILFDHLTDITTIVCTILAFLVPYIVNKVNRKLHEIGDPPWKKQENPE